MTALTPTLKRHIVRGLSGGIIIVLTAGVVYLYTQNQKQAGQIAELLSEQTKLDLENAATNLALNEKLAIANSTNAELAERLNLTTTELEEIESAFNEERTRNEDFEEQIRELAGTVGVLDRLSRTDRELLKKYSETYFLNENFVPLKLAQIDSQYLMNPDRDAYFHGEALVHLENMLSAAKRAGHDIKIVSAYRSFDEQREVKLGHTMIYGRGANAFSADQGFSEHQLGTAVDIVDVDTRILTQDFAKTDAYQWLLANAYRYGFILSYPENNRFFIFEPWHWRFVGRALARELKESNRTFYDVDQRELDTYLIKIFD